MTKYFHPFLLHRQPKLDHKNLIKIVDFGVGNYSTDYTGHAYLGSYLYDRKQFLLNNTYEYSNFYKRPYQGFRNKRRRKKRYNPYLTSQYNQHSNQQNSLQPHKNMITDLSNPSNPNNKQQMQNLPLQETQKNVYLPSELQSKNITSIGEISPLVYVNRQRIPISDWDPLVDMGRNNLKRLPDRTSSMGFDQWYVESIVKNTALDVMEASQTNPFAAQHIKYIDSYRYAKVWWKNESEFGQDKHRYLF